MAFGCFYWIFIKSPCSSGWSALWYSNWATCFPWNFPIEDLRTPRISFRIPCCMGLHWVLCFPELVLFWWVLLLRPPIIILRVISWFGTPTWDGTHFDITYSQENFNDYFLLGIHFHVHPILSLWAWYHHLQWDRPCNI